MKEPEINTPLSFFVRILDALRQNQANPDRPYVGFIRY